MNETFVWSPVFETGLSSVDEQHHRLVALINDASPVLAGAAVQPASAVLSLLDGLVDYARFHFADEERLMGEKQLHPEFVGRHCRLHRDFAADIEAMRFELLNGDAVSFDRVGLLRFLIGWLAYHILGTDQLMAEQIRRIDAGESPDEALRNAGERKDVAMCRPLLDAVTGLLQVISGRNRSLYEMNKALLAAQAELRATNSGLEARVAARARELEHEKSELAATIAKLELTQGQLLQSEKLAAIGQLAAGVAHEINNPVGFVSSNVGSLRKYVEHLLGVVDAGEALRKALPGDDPRRQAFEQAMREADLAFLKEDVRDLLEESENGLGRIKKIVQDLKDFSRIDHAEWEATDLNAGIDSTLNVVWNEIKYKAEVIKEYGELPLVSCIAGQLNQVFMNLLVNAAQAIEGHGMIVIRTGTVGDRVSIEISDNGVGISEALQRRIFEPFFTTKPVGKGTGLGLSISWDIVVKKHGGTLTVNSEPGVGTTFRIELPVAPAVAEQPQALA